MDIRRDIINRYLVVYLLIVVFSTLVVAKVLRIQFSEEGKSLKNMNKKHTKEIVKPKRGDIYSRDGKVLACSVPEYIIYFDYRTPGLQKNKKLFLDNVDDLARKLAELFASEGKSYNDYLKLLNKAYTNKTYVRLHKKPIDYPTLQIIKKFPILKEGPFKGGLLVNSFNNRVYPYGYIARRTIGLIRKGNYHGETGLELQYDEYLYGKEQTKELYDDPALKNKEIETVDGYDVYSTIDTEIQSITNEELYKALTKYKAEWGCAVVMETKTGEILSISNLSLNKGNPADTSYYELENFAVNHRSDPGSTIKLPSLMIALEDGVISLDDVISTGFGHIKYVNKGIETNVYDWNYKTQNGFKDLTVKDVFANSSNIGVSKIIYNHYVTTHREWDYIRRLNSWGLGSKCGIDLHNEREPLIKDPSMTSKNEKQKWEGSTLIQMSYGYDIELTPLQILTFYNAVANNGVLLKPYLVKEVRNSAQTIIKNSPVIVNKAICSQSTIDKAKEMMEAVVETGTAKSIKNNYYKIAGKTGTAQTYTNIGYDEKLLRASFCGYFPADNPKYTCIVVMQGKIPYDPYKVSGGSAAHVFRKISDRIYFNDHELRNQLYIDSSKTVSMPYAFNGYAKDFAKLFSAIGIAQNAKPKSTWVTTIPKETGYDYGYVSQTQTKAPNFYGMGIRDAIFLAENMGLRTKCIGYGKVRNQSIKAGSPIVKKQTIVLEFK